jgi:hypothetical protein
MTRSCARIAPPGQEGWLRQKEKARSIRDAADGVVGQIPKTILVLELDLPPRRALQKFILTCYDRAYSPLSS